VFRERVLLHAHSAAGNIPKRLGKLPRFPGAVRYDTVWERTATQPASREGCTKGATAAAAGAEFLDCALNNDPRGLPFRREGTVEVDVCVARIWGRIGETKGKETIALIDTVSSPFCNGTDVDVDVDVGHAHVHVHAHADVASTRICHTHSLVTSNRWKSSD